MNLVFAIVVVVSVSLEGAFLSMTAGPVSVSAAADSKNERCPPADHERWYKWDVWRKQGGETTKFKDTDILRLERWSPTVGTHYPVDKKKIDTIEWDRHLACHQFHEYFGCHSSPCSIHNEAYWLGNYAFNYAGKNNATAGHHDENSEHSFHFLEQRFLDPTLGEFDSIWTPNQNEGQARRLWDLFTKFAEMRTPSGKLIPKKELQLRDNPYQLEDKPKSLDDDKFKNPCEHITDEWVPNICDPRENLYCRNTMLVDDPGEPNFDKKGKRASGGGPRCACHPMYSMVSDGEHSAKCLGRAHTPCGYVKPVIDDDKKARDDHLYYFHYTKKPSEIKKSKWSETLSKYPLNKLNHNDKLGSCVTNADCQKLNEGTETENFREGKIWRGFGYNPIVAAFIQKTATHICKCEQGFQINAMHECV